MQITKLEAATPASPRSFGSPEYNLPLDYKGNKGDVFNSCSVSQDKCKHFALITYRQGEGKHLVAKAEQYTVSPCKEHTV